MHRMMLVSGRSEHTTHRVSANSVDMDAVLLAGIIKDNPVTVEHVKPFGMSPEILIKLQETWAAFKGPVTSTRRFSVYHEIGETRNGYVVIEMRWNGALDVGVRIFDEDDQEIAGSPIWSADTREKEIEMPKLADIRANFDFEEVIPVAQIKLREKVQQPNNPCACGSNKKYKKCCGRLV